LAVGDPIDGGVVRLGVPDDQIRIGGRGQLGEKRGKVELTYLAGSTRTRRERRERRMTCLLECHEGIIWRGAVRS